MAETGSVVALESLSGSGRRNDVGAVDGRIAENALSGRENGLAKRLETTGVGK